MRVTAQSHPLLFECFEDVAHDSGRRAGHKAYDVPEQYDGWVDDAERGLATLTKEERNDLAIGEHDTMEELRRRSPDLDKVHQLMEAFFEDAEWEKTGGWERD